MANKVRRTLPSHWELGARRASNGVLGPENTEALIHYLETVYNDGIQTGLNLAIEECHQTRSNLQEYHSNTAALTLMIGKLQKLKGN